MTVKNLYTVHVALTVRFWGHEEVEADNPQAAKEIAAERFDCDWNQAVSEGAKATVLTENGHPVVSEPSALIPGGNDSR
jgi:hypothetical protein